MEQYCPRYRHRESFSNNESVLRITKYGIFIIHNYYFSKGKEMKMSCQDIQIYTKNRFLILLSMNKEPINTYRLPRSPRRSRSLPPPRRVCGDVGRPYRAI